MEKRRTILAYHETTKHHFNRYARSAGYMDWHNQPNPFRIFEGCESQKLPLPVDTPQWPYEALYLPEAIPHLPLNAKTLGGFLYHGLAISAWKSAGGSRWSLRVHPSSGNLHPTECYLILPSIDDLAGGVYHYSAFGHALFRRIDLPRDTLAAWAGHFPTKGFGVALSAIFWRESWKYGERAYRYCNLDAGHAAAAIVFAARLNGWQALCLTGAGDQQIATILGFDRTRWRPSESEVPEMIFWISAEGQAAGIPMTLDDQLMGTFESLSVKGNPNPLSREAERWPIIAEAAAAAEKDVTPALDFSPGLDAVYYPPPKKLRAADIIRKRRSAVSYDPTGSIDAETFFAILDRTLPRAGVAPFDAGLPGPSVDLLLFVNRVREVQSGLYLLVRSGSRDAVGQLKADCRPDFFWQPVRPEFPLWLLSAGDVSYDAMEVSCHQQIAAHGAFAVAMLAPMKRVVSMSPFMYRHLHWECGMIGQVLYLEAEAHGLRGTGIGCFFDDPVNALLGITDDTLSSLYHFTIGHPVEDRRISTLPAYHHLRSS